MSEEVTREEAETALRVLEGRAAFTLSKEASARTYRAYLALLDERDRLRDLLKQNEVDPDMPIPPFPATERDRLRARNEKLEAVLVAADSYVKFGTREAALRKAIAAVDEE